MQIFSATSDFIAAITLIPSSDVYIDRSRNLGFSETHRTGYSPPACADSHWYFRLTDPFLNRNNYSIYCSNAI